MTHNIMNSSTYMVCGIINSVYSLILCLMTLTVVIQDGENALDSAKDGKHHEAEDVDDESRYDDVIKYLEEFGK